MSRTYFAVDVDKRTPTMPRSDVASSTSTAFDERVEVGPKTRWFWDPLACQHVSRYLLAHSRVIGREIFDVGCGTGYGSALLARDVRRRVIGVDLSQTAVAYASAAWSRPNLTFRVADALRLDVPRGSADTVVTFETIEHVTDPALFVDKVADLLRPGGRLVLSTPDRTYYSPGSGPGESHNPFHPSEMTRAELLDLIRTRFRVLEVFGQGRPGPSTSGDRASRSILKPIVKRATNWIIGGGRIAEVLLPLVRSRHVPVPADSPRHTYVVVIAERLDDSTLALPNGDNAATERPP